MSVPDRRLYNVTSVHSGSIDLCTTGKTFLSNCIAFVYYVTPRILKALSISSVTHMNTHSIIGNATTMYEEFLWGKGINQSVLMK
jgi:cbb3-type cytochrome oxidase subunit 1